MITTMSERQTADGQEAHDVLAAEEFAMPTLDPTLHHGPVSLPEDPTGAAEPHDVLAAEEFAFPAARKSWAGVVQRNQRPSASPIVAIVGLLLLVVVVRRVLRRG
jgi:hypothetical protein